MPKLRSIDFNKIKNGNKEEARRVIKDLLMLTPRGATQKQRGNEYFKFERHPGKESILKTAPDYVQHFASEGGSNYNFGYSYEPLAEWWGYTNEQLYWTAKALGATGTWLGESDFRSILQRHFSTDGYGNYGAKLTRGARRLERRFSTGWKNAITGGKLGDLAFTCRIETPQIERSGGYYGPTTQASMDISFAATNQAEASMMLQTMFSHAVQSTEPRFTAWSAAEPAQILSANMDEISSLKKAREKAVAQLAEIQQYIKNIDTLEEAVQMYSLNICD